MTATTPHGTNSITSTEQDKLKAIVYQVDPKGAPNNAVSLGWMAKTVHQNTTIHYDWTVDYSFVWGENGSLAPGTSYRAGQVIPADLTSHNTVTLEYPEEAFKFTSTSQTMPAGSMYIHQAKGVPDAGGCVGIGMQGAGTFVAPTHETGEGQVAYTPNPQYWIGFGNYTPGIVVSRSELYFPIHLQFPTGMNYADCVYTAKDEGGEYRGWQVKFQSTPPS